MEVPDIASFARDFSVMVRVQGPDPKGLKMQRHPFHQYRHGITTISSSGILLSDALGKMIVGDKERCISMRNEAIVVTVASVVESFLVPRHNENCSEGVTELIPGAQIDVMAERKVARKSGLNKLDKSPCWLSAQLFSMVDCVSRVALQSLLGVTSSSDSLEHTWEVGWSLASYSNDFLPSEDPIDVNALKDIKFSGEVGNTFTLPQSGHRTVLEISNTKIALLRVSMEDNMVTPKFLTSSSCTRGEFLLMVGSPFGILSPVHFFNSISVGSIANMYGSDFSSSPLLMADMRCLPGMEGGPVCDKQARLVGMLTTPLRQKSSSAEIHIVIPWEAIVSACNGQQPHRTPLEISSLPRLDTANGLPSTWSSPLLMAMSSICLITTPAGAWASGVLLDCNGLVVTNAHLLEPWRFGRKVVGHTTFNTFTHTLSGAKPVYFSHPHEETSNVGAHYYGRSSIHVRVNHGDSWLWSNATVVYISGGVLDIALLQLDQCNPLHHVVADFTCPSPGSEAFIIGHGLFGPRIDISPSINRGVISKVIKIKLDMDGPPEEVPVMLETTAAVYPGSSGGAVFNSEGRMVALVTSNTKHGGGTTIPYLNFSIPCAALKPVFKFSSAGVRDLSLLKKLEEPEEQLSSVWALMPPPSSQKGAPSAREGEDGNVKGARFAKFIAERRDIVEGSNHAGKKEKVLDYASKL